jgi:hypothetical protein
MYSVHYCINCHKTLGVSDLSCSRCHQNEITALREENERLRNQVIVRHKWPDEAPKTNGWKIGFFRIPGGAKYWDKAYFSAPNRWEHDGRYYDPYLWAEMPEEER